ncbi:MAG: hypothetical protein Q8M08_09885 [Bacteroidales bacterium]|nr:hypothetical protein [Bacteroidales bacterium]
MPYQADTEIDLTAKTTSNYIISSQHRRVGNPNKCRWTVSFADEVDCFINSINNNWKDGTKAWGMKMINAALIVVGLNDDNEELKLAKFIDGTGKNVWHGYPADYANRSQDRPTNTILQMWVVNGYISKAKMTKINRGFSCNL